MFRTSFKSLVALGLLSSSTSAFAGVDLRTTFTAPASTPVYATGRYTVNVKNLGSTHANNVSVQVFLPETNTSPYVFVMGTLVGQSVGCTVSGTVVTCPMGQVKAGKTKTVYVDLQIAETTVPAHLEATATPNGQVDTNTANNSFDLIPTLSNPSIVVPPDVLTVNDHCTGTGLTSFWECVVSPGSIMSHDTEFLSNGDVTFPALGPDYGGSWSQPSPDRLIVDYTELGLPFGHFEGYAVDAHCWEGEMDVGNPAYTVMYSICF